MNNVDFDNQALAAIEELEALAQNVNFDDLDKMLSSIEDLEAALQTARNDLERGFLKGILFARI